MTELRRHYDVVVIGSGFGGAVAASTLSEAGASVLVVERGPWRDTEPVREAGVTSRSPLPYGKHFYRQLIHRIASGWTKGLVLNGQGLFDLHFGRDLSIVCSNSVGGGSHVYSAMNTRPRHPGYWNGHTDGIDAATMEPHYDWMLDKMGARRPSPADRIPNATCSRFADSKHFIADNSIAQPAMSSRMEGRSEDYRDNSYLGSPNGAKATLDRVLLLPAMKQGLTIADRHECMSLWQKPKAGFRLELMNHRQQRRRYVQADRVVLAAGTLNTVRLLFRSRSLGGLQGMPALGRGIGGNGDTPAYWALNTPGADYTTGTPCHGRFALRDGRSGGALPGPYLTSFGLNGIDTLPLPKRLKRRLRQDLILVSMGTDNADGIMTWKHDRLVCRYLRQNSPVLDEINLQLQEVARRSGRPVWFSSRFPLTVHPLGGARLGASAQDGVVDHNGEVYGNRGLFIADAATLPSAPGTPPSMTISAWSRHVALRLIDPAMPIRTSRQPWKNIRHEETL